MNERPQYRSDQGVAIARLPALIVGTMLAAAAVAWAFKFLFLHNFFYVGLVPLAGGAILGIAIMQLVEWSHCRNRSLAAGIGISAALAAYLGYFYLCMIEVLPPGNAARVDLLPRYIVVRLKTEVKEDIAGPRNGNLREPVPVINLMYLVLELTGMSGLAAWFAQLAAARAYCPPLSQWMQEEAALFPSFFGPQLQQALAGDRLEELLAVGGSHGADDADAAVTTARVNDANTACRFVLEYALPADGSLLAYPIYASIEDLPAKKSWFRLSNNPVRATLTRQVLLTTQEVLTVCPLFPKLSEALRAQHAELEDLPAAAPPVFGSLAETSDVAVIAPVPDPFRQRVRSKGYALKVNLLDVLPLAIAAAGGGLLFLGGYLVSEQAVALSIGPFVLGACGVAWGLYTAQYCMSVHSNRWIDRRLRAEIALRPDLLVNPDDSQAVYASIIPRENWTRVQMTMSSDLLLLKIDDARRQVLLEGDCDRYQIPAGAIAECQPECFFHRLDAQHRNHLWMVRMTIRAEAGLREVLFAIHFRDFWPFTNSRRKQTAELACQRINGMRAAGTGA